MIPLSTLSAALAAPPSRRWRPTSPTRWRSSRAARRPGRPAAPARRPSAAPSSPAAAAAVLRGELDPDAVANAEALAPEAVGPWREVLPTPTALPQAWIDPWLASPPPRPAPPPPRRIPETPVRAPLPAEVEAGIGLLASPWPGATLGGRAELRAPVDALAATVRGSWARAGTLRSADTRIGLAQLPVDTVGLTAGLGASWVAGGASLVPQLLLDIERSAFTPAGAAVARAHGVDPAPALQLGAGFGTRIVAPLGRTFAFRSSGEVLLARRLAGAGTLPAVVVGPKVPGLLRVASTHALQWDVGPDRWMSIGTVVCLSQPLESGDPFGEIGAVLAFGWRP
ncbi:MAG: hypothetical protein R3F59_01395 [Myxococcota bacterium]